MGKLTILSSGFAEFLVVISEFLNIIGDLNMGRREEKGALLTQGLMDHVTRTLRDSRTFPGEREGFIHGERS